MKMTLENLQSAALPKAVRLCLYGPPGVGKTTAATTQTPSPILLQGEDGAIGIDVPTFPVAETPQDYIDAIETLIHSDHDFKTLVIDSASTFQRAAMSEIAKLHGVTSFSDIKYGAGNLELGERLSQLFGALETLRRSKGVHVVMIAHARITTFADPQGEAYDRYIPDVHERWALPALIQWADIVSFADFDKYRGTVREGKMKIERRIARSSGKRLMYNEHSAAFEAKNRFGLPQSMPLDLNAVFLHVGEFYANKGGRNAPSTTDA